MKTGDVRIFRQGAEHQPLILIDDFAVDPDGLIEDAAMLRLEPNGPHYPGLRAPVPKGMVAKLLAPVTDLIREVFGVDAGRGRRESWYSLVTTPPDRLAPIQRLPHFDGVEADRIAILLFLGRADLGGTAFYRHRATGFETVTAERLAPYDSALRADIDRHGLPPPAYIAGDTPLYERIARHEARFNRLLIYRGHTLHCADVPPDLVLCADPREGRLTVNTFLIPAGAA